MFCGLLSLAGLAGACDASLTGDDSTNQGGGSASTSTSVGSGFGTGLPCDVVDVMVQCAACHATATPSGGVSIASYDDLVAASPSDPSVTVAERALARMKDAANPMPPNGQLAAADIATFEAWVQGGMTQGNCDTVVEPPGSVCTSDTHWTLGDEGSEDMHPGMACISCHKQSAEPGEDPPPIFLFAGTVYATVHEPDDCNGGGAGISGSVVVVTDANGVEHSATVRASGNFLLEGVGVLATPIHAEVRSADGTKVNKMKDPVDSGDCNSCHTENGLNDAPGRILAP
jgi:mono/diheme cytochrome c family protein